MAVAVCVCAVLTAARAGDAGEQQRRCPRGIDTIAQSQTVRVYKVRDRDSRRDFAVDACNRRTGELWPVDLPASDIYAFLGPAIHLRGSILGYAQQVCGPDGYVEGGDGGSCFSLINVQNLGQPGGDDSNGGPAGPRPRQLWKVGSLRVKANGSVAWIACPERKKRRAIGLRNPNCVRAGDYNYVMADEVGSKRQRVLGRGRGIDPASLRLAGSTVSWVKNGRRIRARMR